MGERTASYGAIDIGKFVAAILVVAIHVLPFSGRFGFYFDHCIARIADPFFFIASAFFVFRKAFAAGMSWETLGNYMRRICALYSAWVLVYAPVILYRLMEELPAGLPFWELILRIFFQFLRRMFLTGPYGALWFLTALLLAMPLTFAVTKYLGPSLCLIVSFPFFLLTVLQMEYTVFVAEIEIFQQAVSVVTAVFGWLGNGLTYGFFFCSLGMYAAYSGEKERNRRRDAVILGVSLLLLVLECSLIREYELGQSYGAMFFLIPTAYYLFQLLRQLPLASGKVCLLLRKSSILIFTAHYGVMELLQYLLRGRINGTVSGTLLYVMVLAVTVFIAWIILGLSRHPKLSWLKILY